MKAMSAALAKNNNHLITDWNNREQLLAQHADDLSKTIDKRGWKKYAPMTDPPWVFDLVIHDPATDECVQAQIRIPRLGQALP